MTQTEEIILKLLKIRKGQMLADSGRFDADDVEKLREYVAELRREIPPFALEHFDRFEESGKSGLSPISEGCVCSACGGKVSAEELEFIKKNRNIGVCDSCFSFLYIPDEKFEIGNFFEKFLRK